MKLNNEEGKEVGGGGGGGEFGKELNLKAGLKLEIPAERGDEVAAAAVDVEKQQQPVVMGKGKEREREKEMSNGGIPSPESLEAQ